MYNDRTVVEQSISNLSDIALNVEFGSDAFDVSHQVPEGLAVNVKDAPTIDFRWEDGSLSKITDPNAVGLLDRLTFRGGAGSRATLLIVFNVLFLALLGGVLFVRRRSMATRPPSSIRRM